MLIHLCTILKDEHLLLVQRKNSPFARFCHVDGGAEKEPIRRRKQLLERCLVLATLGPVMDTSAVLPYVWTAQGF